MIYCIRFRFESHRIGVRYCVLSGSMYCTRSAPSHLFFYEAHLSLFQGSGSVLAKHPAFFVNSFFKPRYRRVASTYAGS